MMERGRFPFLSLSLSRFASSWILRLTRRFHEALTRVFTML